MSDSSTGHTVHFNLDDPTKTVTMTVGDRLQIIEPALMIGGAQIISVAVTPQSEGVLKTKKRANAEVDDNLRAGQSAPFDTEVEAVGLGDGTVVVEWDRPTQLNSDQHTQIAVTVSGKPNQS